MSEPEGELPRKPAHLFLPALLVLLLAGAAAIFVWQLFPSRKQPAKKPASELGWYDRAKVMEDEAFGVATNLVKRELIAPRTAIFCDRQEAIAFGDGASNVTVSGYVDAQNSFGALLRKQFYCELEYRGTTNKWFCRQLDIDYKARIRDDQLVDE
jgi:hypothetical protein